MLYIIDIAFISLVVIAYISPHFFVCCHGTSKTFLGCVCAVTMHSALEDMRKKCKKRKNLCGKCRNTLAAPKSNINCHIYWQCVDILHIATILHVDATKQIDNYFINHLRFTKTSKIERKNQLNEPNIWCVRVKLSIFYCDSIKLAVWLTHEKVQYTQDV